MHTNEKQSAEYGEPCCELIDLCAHSSDLSCAQDARRRVERQAAEAEEFHCDVCGSNTHDALACDPSPVPMSAMPGYRLGYQTAVKIIEALCDEHEGWVAEDKARYESRHPGNHLVATVSTTLIRAALRPCGDSCPGECGWDATDRNDPCSISTDPMATYLDRVERSTTNPKVLTVVADERARLRFPPGKES